MSGDNLIYLHKWGLEKFSLVVWCLCLIYLEIAVLWPMDRKWYQPESHVIQSAVVCGKARSFTFVCKFLLIMDTAVIEIEVAVTAKEFCRNTRQWVHFSFCQGPAGFREMWGTFILHVLKFSPCLQHFVSKAGDVKVAMYSGVAMCWG